MISSLIVLVDITVTRTAQFLLGRQFRIVRILVILTIELHEKVVRLPKVLKLELGLYFPTFLLISTSLPSSLSTSSLISSPAPFVLSFGSFEVSVLNFSIKGDIEGVGEGDREGEGDSDGDGDEVGIGLGRMQPYY